MPKSETTKLATHIGDIGFSIDSRVHASSDGMLLGGKSETVVAQCVQYVVTRHSLKASVNIGGDITEGMTDMQSRSTRIGEHIEDKQFRSTGHLVSFT